MRVIESVYGGQLNSERRKRRRSKAFEAKWLVASWRMKKMLLIVVWTFDPLTLLVGLLSSPFHSSASDGFMIFFVRFKTYIIYIVTNYVIFYSSSTSCLIGHNLRPKRETFMLPSMEWPSLIFHISTINYCNIIKESVKNWGEKPEVIITLYSDWPASL